MKALARMVRASPSTIRDIENGRNRATTKLLQLAKALRVNPQWLDTGKGPQAPVVPNESTYIAAESIEDLADKLLDKGPEDIAELIKLIVERGKR
jgi:transcriptional regulator with XRE-family HTH domain